MRGIRGGREDSSSRAGASLPYQPTLFPMREPLRVVPIHPHGQTTASRTPRARLRPDGGPQAAAFYQQAFDWPGPAGRLRQASQEAVRYCSAPVATPMHRAAAAVLDFSLVLIAVGIVVAGLHAAVGEELVNPRTLPYFAAMTAIFGFAYKLLWATAGADSPGLRWTHLRTVNFDGWEPTRHERTSRILTGCLSLLAAGLGLLWALADEETLSWHDHMSKTFLTTWKRQDGEVS